MTDEARIQGIARFMVGFGPEEDHDWGDYHFDFCGHINYDKSGKPIEVKPVGKSGYSLGCLQLDFGQSPDAAEPFVSAFDAWHSTNPKTKPLVGTHAFAVKALKMQGHSDDPHEDTLHKSPDAALCQQDIAAFSDFVLSPQGSDWVNTHIDNGLIGSDTQKSTTYGGKSLVRVAREMEATQAFKSAETQKNSGKTDLLYAMTMKAYNQGGPGRYKELLEFLDRDPDDEDITQWPNGYSEAFCSGVTNAINYSNSWTKIITPTADWTPPRWLLALQDVMETQGLGEPTRGSSDEWALSCNQTFF